MQRFAVLTLVFLFGLAAVAQADPVVTLGTYTIQTNVAVTAIPIYVYNNPATGNMTEAGGPGGGVQGVDFNIAIGNADGSAGPVFVAGTPGVTVPTNSAYVGGPGFAGASKGGDLLTGTIFSSTTHTNPADGGGSSSQNLQIGIGVSSGVATMSTSPGVSLLATIYVSTTGVAAGTKWALLIGGGNDLGPTVVGNQTTPGNLPLDFGDGGAFNTVLTDGIINVVPEPTSIVMALFAVAGLGAVAIRRARRA